MDRAYDLDQRILGSKISTASRILEVLGKVPWDPLTWKWRHINGEPDQALTSTRVGGL